MTTAATEGDVSTSAKPAEKKRHFNIKRRRRSETRFKVYGVIALAIGIAFLGLLLFSIISKGYQGFVVANIELEVTLAPEVLDPDRRLSGSSADEAEEALMGVRLSRYESLLKDAIATQLEANGLGDRQSIAEGFLSRSGRVELRRLVAENPSLVGTTQSISVLATADVDSYIKGVITRETPEIRRQLSDAELEMVDELVDAGVIQMEFNSGLFLNTSSKRPEAAGLSVALIGSLQMMLVVLALTLPIGVAASIYLEEFAPKNRVTDLIEVNINNLAAVPSIVFGILGLAVFINFMGLPRSAALVGGMVLTLMTLPTIIIATRASLRAVPPSIRQAALGVGASKMQSIFHHVLPLAMPGILTGTIIGLAQALGETAPLLLIGMDAFVQDVPNVLVPTEPATSMPSQIYQWSREDDRTSFDPKTSAAIMVLLGFLALMNLTAVLLRKRFERRW